MMLLDSTGQIRCYVSNPIHGPEEAIRTALRKEWFENIPPLPQGVRLTKLAFHENSFFALSETGHLLLYGRELDCF